MLRTRRSVQTMYSTAVSFISSDLVPAADEGKSLKRSHDAMANAEAEAEAEAEHAGGISAAPGTSVAFVSAGITGDTGNPEEIAMDEDDEDEDEGADEGVADMELQQISVPRAVFGAAADLVEDAGQAKEETGALARFKRG